MATQADVVQKDVDNVRGEFKSFKDDVDKKLSELTATSANILTMLEEYIQGDIETSTKHNSILNQLSCKLTTLEKETKIVRIFTANKKLATLSTIGAVLVFGIATGFLDIHSKNFTVSKNDVEVKTLISK